MYEVDEIEHSEVSSVNKKSYKGLRLGLERAAYLNADDSNSTSMSNEQDVQHLDRPLEASMGDESSLAIFCYELVTGILLPLNMAVNADRDPPINADVCRGYFA